MLWNRHATNDETMDCRRWRRLTVTVQASKGGRVLCASQYGNSNKLKSLKLKVYLVIDVDRAPCEPAAIFGSDRLADGALVNAASSSAVLI